jgi:DNA-binding NtrC family response regulator
MHSATRVLVIDADNARIPSLLELLAAAGYEGHHATCVESATEHLARAGTDVVLLSFDAGGLGALTRIAAAAPHAEVVLQSCASREIEAREGLRLGASDVTVWERGTDVLLFALERAARDGRRRQELALLRARASEQAAGSLVGRSAPMLALRELVGRAAASRMTVLVTGEPGTGKDVVARLVHDLSDRAGRPFVALRCHQMQADAVEAELFGGKREGLLERVRGGTLVIDEARSMPRALRERLALVLADRLVDRGSPGSGAPVDVRLILTARTPADSRAPESHELLGEWNFVPISLPALRDRRSDIPLLVKHFRDRIARDTGTSLAALAPEEITPLLGHQWPGNVRELEHWVERMVYAAAGHEAAKATSTVPGSEFAQLDTARLSLDALERKYILHVLAQEQGHQSRTAERLGIDRRTLYRKLKEYRDEDAANDSR